MECYPGAWVVSLAQDQGDYDVIVVLNAFHGKHFTGVK